MNTLYVVEQMRKRYREGVRVGFMASAPLWILVGVVLALVAVHFT